MSEQGANRRAEEKATGDITRSSKEKPAGRNRRELAENASLDPNSLASSWFLQLDEEGDAVGWGLVLGQPHQDNFLVEISEGGVMDPPEKAVRYQCLVSPDQMADEKWRFFDTIEDLHRGFLDFVIGDRA